jgi:putative aminopeptidase FrvX
VGSQQQRIAKVIACALIGSSLAAVRIAPAAAAAAPQGGTTGGRGIPGGSGTAASRGISGASAARGGPPLPGAGDAADAGRDLADFLRVAAVAGRDQAAADFLRRRLGRRLPVRSDALGNLTVTFGSGQPRRLVACPLGEPGFVVSRVDADGYLRLAAAAGDASPAGALWQQAHEGQLVWVAGSRGEVPGVVAARSIHLQPRGEPAAPPFTIADAYVDIGAEDAAQAAELGIRPLDPVALDRRPARLAGGLIAGPAARAKAACLAAAAAARRFRTAPGKGSVVFAWTTGDLSHGAGIDGLLRQRGPFSEVVFVGGGFGPRRQGGPESLEALPAPGSGPIAAGATAGGLPGVHVVPYAAPRLRPDETALDPARVVYLGLPAQYPGTAVETVAAADMERLSSALLSLLGSTAPARQRRPSTPTPPAGSSSSAPSPPSPAAASPAASSPAAAAPAATSPPVSSFSPPAASAPAATSPPVSSFSSSAASAPASTSPPVSSSSPPAASAPSPAARPLADSRRHGEIAALIGELVSRYGVSGDETAVRTAIAAQLPPWAHPVVDWAGNLAVTAGDPRAGSNPLLFMAHMDEIGFRVNAVLPDGRLSLQARGGLYPSLWEGQAALVHGRRGPVPAVFEPRPDWLTASHRNPAGDLTAFLGAGSAPAAAALGVQAGAGVTMPKALLRLGRHRLTARSLDDRAGAAVLLLALRRIDPSRLHHRLTFAWTTREEIGFLGAAALAHGRGAYRRVYPVDAFPTSDSPRESRRSGDIPLGHGAVLPAAAPAALLAAMRGLGRRHGIALQVALIPGGNDGVPFQAGDAAVLPLTWPCRYTHTPAEVSDLRDLEALVDLVAALATEERE